MIRLGTEAVSQVVKAGITHMERGLLAVRVRLVPPSTASRTFRQVIDPRRTEYMPGRAEEDVAELVDVVCHTCRIVLPLLDSPAGRAAWWKFLDEHAYHQVELLWEHSEAHERIDIDYIEVGSDIRSDPSFAEYAGEWPGRSLALQPRPIARAVAEIVQRAQDALDAHEWRAVPADAVVAERALKYLDFAPPPGETVHDAAVLARLSAVEAALGQLRSAAAEPVGEHFGTLLNDFLRVLPTTADLPPDELCAESGPLASPRLWGTERALRLIQHLVSSITLRKPIPDTDSVMPFCRGAGGG